MKKSVWFLLCFAMSYMQALPLQAQQPVATLSVEPDTCTIGDDIFYTISILKKPTIRLQYPTDTASFQPFEIRQLQTLPAETQEKMTLEKVRYTLTIFDTGVQYLPPIRIVYTDQETQQQDSLTLGNRSVYVRSVLDTAKKDISDIKPVRSVPIPLWVYLAGGGLLLLLAVGIYLLVKYLRKHPKMVEPVSMALALTPFEIATEKLKLLENYTLQSQSDYKAYYTALSNTVREFLEHYYGFPAMEQLTSEINAVMQARRPKEEADRIRTLLEEADLVKFAKFQPEVLHAREMLRLAFQIIEVGKPKETDTVKR
jgi:hypothetical protein